MIISNNYLSMIIFNYQYVLALIIYLLLSSIYYNNNLGDVNILNLLWSSATSTSPVMKWGTTSKVYNTVVEATTEHIEKQSLCGEPAISIGWRDLGLIHTVSFIGMKELAGEKVYYIFGDEVTNDFSGEYVLHVPPLPGMIPATSTDYSVKKKDSTNNNNILVRPTRAILFDDLGQ